MRVRSVVLSFVSAMLLVFAIGCAKQEPPQPAAPAAPAADGKTLFESKCGVCHGLDRPTALKETKEKWASIVKEMQGKKSDWISDADASKIVEYLSAQYGKK
jgi:mono/diheme cytochrome c family protein